MTQFNEKIELLKKSVEENYTDVSALSNWLTKNPEVSGKEKKSSEYIIKFLENYGYEVEAPYFGVPYSFRAINKKDKNSNKKKVALMCEYDALPERGHACGHSVSCGISVLAALVINNTFENFPFQIDIIGTPDEEVNGGKILMGKEAFEEYEFAIMAHLYNHNAPFFYALASTDMEITFKGRSSHASTSPWEGKNALNALQLFFHATDMLRQHVPPDVQIHGIIKNGGILPSIVPDKAVGHFYPRSATLKGLNELIKRLENCVKGAALCTETTYEIKNLYNTFPEVSCSKPAFNLVSEVFDALDLEWSSMEKPAGSTDIGFVDTVIPVFQPMIAIGKKEDNIQLHSLEMAELVNISEATITIKNGANTIAGIITALAYDDDKLETIKRQHKLYREL